MTISPGKPPLYRATAVWDYQMCDGAYYRVMEGHCRTSVRHCNEAFLKGAWGNSVSRTSTRLDSKM